MNYKTASEILDDLCLEKTAGISPKIISELTLAGAGIGGLGGALYGNHRKKLFEKDPEGFSKQITSDDELSNNFEEEYGVKPSPEQLQEMRRENIETFNKTKNGVAPILGALGAAGGGIVGRGIAEGVARKKYDWYRP